MALGLFHHVGVFLLLAACVLLLITTISAPVVNHIAILKVHLQNGDSINFGTFGYCLMSSQGDSCTKSHIGYHPARLLESLDVGDFGSASTDTADMLTRAMILHPIACGLSFIAFLTAIGASTIGSLCASLVSAIAWLITLVVLITDFVGWGIVKKKVNDDNGSGSHASFAVGIWTLLAAFVVLFFGSIIVFFSCCSGRRKRRAGRSGKAEPVFVEGAPRRKRRFWQRGSRY